MLWKDDFVEERDWVTICKVFGVPSDTEKMELSVRVITHFPYIHRHVPSELKVLNLFSHYVKIKFILKQEGERNTWLEL